MRWWWWGGGRGGGGEEGGGNRTVAICGGGEEQGGTELWQYVMVTERGGEAYTEDMYVGRVPARVAFPEPAGNGELQLINYHGLAGQEA